MWIVTLRSLSPTTRPGMRCGVKIRMSKNSRIAITFPILLLANAMKLFTEPHPTGLGFFFLALASYALFLLLAVVSRAGKGRAPLGPVQPTAFFRTAAAYILSITMPIAPIEHKMRGSIISRHFLLFQTHCFLIK